MEKESTEECGEFPLSCDELTKFHSIISLDWEGDESKPGVHTQPPLPFEYCNYLVMIIFEASSLRLAHHQL